MVETEMSIQSDLSKMSSNYSKIGTDEDCFIDPKDIKLGIYTKEKDDPNYYNNNNNSASDHLIPIAIEKGHNYFYKKIGNTYAFFGNIYGDPKIIIGPHWPLYFLVTAFFTFGVYLVYKNFGDGISMILKVIGIIIYLIFLISYTYTATINPGYPKHDIDSITGEPRKKFYFCNVCKFWANREKKTMHCPDCNICIEGNDHHCPWTGKCIAKNNTFSFYIFLVSVLCAFCYFVSALTHAQHTMFLLNKKK